MAAITTKLLNKLSMAKIIKEHDIRNNRAIFRSMNPQFITPNISAILPMEVLPLLSKASLNTTKPKSFKRIEINKRISVFETYM